MIYLLIIIPVFIIALFWTNGIDRMKNDYPDYNGDDLFGEDENDN
jgi:hypothetical protein